MRYQILVVVLAVSAVAGAQIKSPTPGVPSPLFPGKGDMTGQEGVRPVRFSTLDRKVDLGPVFGVPNKSKARGNDDFVGGRAQSPSPTLSTEDFSDWTSGTDAYQLIRNFSDTLTTTLAPPDNHAAVGGEWIVEAVNSNWAIYDKCGNRQFSQAYSATLSDTTNFLFDPKVIFDPWSKRWFMLILRQDGTAQTSGITVMVSDDSNPHGTWWSYTFNGVLSTGAARDWADYYDLGYGQQAIYISGNHFRWTGGAFTGGAGWILNKSQMLNHETVNWTRYFPLSDMDGNLMFAPRAARMMSVFGTTDGIFASTIHSGGNNNLYYTKISDPLGAATLTKKKIDIGAYSKTPGMTQPGGTDINGLGEDCRLLNAVVANDAAGGTGIHFYSSLHVRHRWDGDTADRAAVRINNVDPFADTKRFATTYGANARYYFYPSIAPDYRGQAFIVFGRCGTAANEFAELRFTTVEGGIIQNSDRIQAGAGNYTRLTNGTVRWGDYFGADLDWGDYDRGNPSGTGGRHRMWGFGQASTTANNAWINATGGAVVNSTPASMFVSAPANVVWRRVQGNVGAGGFPAQDYTISMTGEVGFNWEVVNVPNWITITPARMGELFRGQTKVVTATVNAAANALGFGRHVATLRFRNCYTGGIVERVFELSIGKWVNCIGIIELQGFLLTGDHTDLAFADNQYARFISDDMICHMKFTFNGLIDGGERIYAFQETSVARPGLIEETYLWNFNTNGWQYVSSRSATMSDQGYYSVNYLPADPLVNSATYSHLALRWLPINDEEPAFDGWEHRVDQLNLFEYP